MIKKKVAFGICIVVLAAALVFFNGPRVVIDETIYPVALPQDLDRFIAAREREFDDIIPGADKKITWAAQTGLRTEYAVVYVHGFSATRQETAPLADRVAKQLKANLFYTRMNGHGRTGAALAQASVNAWLNDTVEAFEIGKRLGRRVIMIGVSTGGTAVTWLAARADAGHLHACVLISPNFGPADRTSGILTWPWGQQIAELVIGKQRRWEGQNPLHAKYWTNQYPTAALLPMMGMVQLADSLDLGMLKTPVLVIYSPKDRIVNPKATVKAYAAMGSGKKRIIPYVRSGDPNQHVLAGNILSPATTVQVAEMIIDFVAQE
jgi:esterase/lipase